MFGICRYLDTREAEYNSPTIRFAGAGLVEFLISLNSCSLILRCNSWAISLPKWLPNLLSAFPLLYSHAFRTPLVAYSFFNVR